MIELNQPYFHRDWSQDFLKPDTLGQSGLGNYALRIFKAGMPLVATACPSFGKAIATGMGAIRTTTKVIECATVQEGSSESIYWRIFQASLAGSSLIATLFYHPLGMVVATSQDMAITSKCMYHALTQGEREEAVKQTLHLVNNALYFVIMFYGGSYMQITSLMVQVVAEGAESVGEWKQGHYIEAAGKLAMVAMRGNQAYGVLQCNSICRQSIDLAVESDAEVVSLAERLSDYNGTKLNIRASGLSDKGLIQLAAILPQLHVESLNLSNIEFGLKLHEPECGRYREPEECYFRGLISLIETLPKTSITKLSLGKSYDVFCLATLEEVLPLTQIHEVCFSFDVPLYLGSDDWEWRELSLTREEFYDFLKQCLWNYRIDYRVLSDISKLCELFESDTVDAEVLIDLLHTISSVYCDDEDWCCDALGIPNCLGVAYVELGKEEAYKYASENKSPLAYGYMITQKGEHFPEEWGDAHAFLQEAIENSEGIEGYPDAMLGMALLYKAIENMEEAIRWKTLAAHSMQKLRESIAFFSSLSGVDLVMYARCNYRPDFSVLLNGIARKIVLDSI